MPECRNCHEFVNFLKVRRFVEQEASLHEEDFEIHEETVAEDRYYCPFCNELLFVHENDASAFFFDYMEREAEILAL